MKIALFLFKYFPYGGLQRDFLRIALLLSQQYSVEIFTTVWQGEIPHGLAINIIPVTGYSNHKRIQNFAKKALQQAKQQRCEFIIGFNKMPGLDIYFAADNCYVKTAQEKHGILYRLTPRYRQYSALEQQVFAPYQKTKILLLAENQRKDYQQIYQTEKERFYLLPAEFNRLETYPVDKTFLQKIRQSHGIKENEYLVLMVCSAFKTKGVDRALNALSQLHSDLLAKTHLLMIGDDHKEPFLRLAKQLQVDAQVQFLGARKNVLEYMCAADLFLHPARQEAGGKVILEAMSCGLPVLTTTECGYAEHMSKADAGILLPQKNIERLLPEALSFMLMDDAKRAAWQKQALDYVAHYPVTDLAVEAMQVIQTTINNYG